jgi:hypothetical protein
VFNTGSAEGGRCHIIISISKDGHRLVDPSGSNFKDDDDAIAKAEVIAIEVSLDKPAVDPERHIAVLNDSREQSFSAPVYSCKLLPMQFVPIPDQNSSRRWEATAWQTCVQINDERLLQTEELLGSELF